MDMFAREVRLLSACERDKMRQRRRRRRQGDGDGGGGIPFRRHCDVKYTSDSAGVPPASRDPFSKVSRTLIDTRERERSSSNFIATPICLRRFNIARARQATGVNYLNTRIGEFRVSRRENL